MTHIKPRFVVSESGLGGAESSTQDLCFITEADFMLKVKSLLNQKGLKRKVYRFVREEQYEEPSNTRSDVHACCMLAGCI